jgi:cell division protein FtsA
MAGPEILLGLDIGTTKVAAVIAGGGSAVAARRPLAERLAGGFASGPGGSAVRRRRIPPTALSPAGTFGSGAGRTAGIRILGAASVPCAGLRRGTVVDVAETTRSIQEAVAKAQRMAGVEVDLAWVGVTGQHIACLNSRGEIQLARANREISWSDVERVMAASVGAVSIPPDRQLIHAISRGFLVDDEPRVKNPIGLSANRLAVDTHVVTASRNLVDNLVRCVEAAGLGVAELVAEPLATADAILSEDEQELGVLLVDVGGGTTDIALFAEGSVCYTGAIRAAGNNVTHDLAIALGITHPQAEQIKLAHGCARMADVPEEQMIALRRAEAELPRRVGPDGEPLRDLRARADEQERTVGAGAEGSGRAFSERPTRGGGEAATARFIAEVIEARLQEIFRLVVLEMSKVGALQDPSGPLQGPGGAKWPPPGGAVITGGGSLLPGITSVAQEALSCRARLGRPRLTEVSGAALRPAAGGGSGLIQLLESPALATAVGLVYWGHREAEARRAEPRPTMRLVPVLGRVIAWARELFGS